jgi:hypothetical protein
MENCKDIENYMAELDQLRLFLKDLLKKEYLEELLGLYEQLERAYLAKWSEMVDKSEHGRKCNYAIQAMTLFKSMKEKDVSDKIKQIYEKYLKEENR